MRYWIDTEYFDDGLQVHLISLAIAAEDDREYYAVSTEFDPAAVNSWIREHVLPYLEGRDSPVWRSLAEIREGVVRFIGNDSPEFWSDCGAAFDWFLLVRLFGTLDHLPRKWPYNCWDVQQLQRFLGVRDIPKQEGRVHHALEDARHRRRVHQFLTRRG